MNWSRSGKQIWMKPASSGSNKFKGKYFQGYVTELEKTSNAEDMVEVSLTFGVNGTGEKGECDSDSMHSRK